MSSEHLKIRREDTCTAGRYVATIDGIPDEGELTYRHLADHVVSADHTGVPDAFRGKGVARALVTRLIEDARKEGFKIVARCSYVEAERRKHPEWADVFKT